MEFATQKSGLAHVADAGATGPSDRDVAGLGEFQQALEAVVPWHGQAAASEGYERAVSDRSNWGMRDLRFGFHYAGLDRVCGTEDLLMNCSLLNA